MFNELSRKITIALTAIIIFCTIVSGVIYVFDKNHFLSFSDLWLTFFILVSPMFLVFGVGVSFILRKKHFAEIKKIIIYIVVAAVITIPYSAYLFELNTSNAFYYLLFGAIAGAIFYLAEFLLNKLYYMNSGN